ncbi:uncharacterized protein [Phyllobates terribilis]|uniref:uncharacterized protein n=1 Tax=Phyllobates terribilis TaxID=111132 RepID=UPI003CCA6F38
MGRPPSTGGPAFRFTHNEVAEMEAILQENKLQIPSKDLIVNISERFSQSTERAGKVLVQTKQVWNWFQNRRYALRSKFAKPPVKLTVTQLPRVDVGPARNVAQGSLLQPAQSAGRNTSDNNTILEFEARSARDGAWYDVQAFVSHRYPDTKNPEVLVRFAGFGLNEEEWVNVRKHIRQRSLPCESSECVAVLPGDLVLCFQEGKEQALYFDAHILDAQRRRHDDVRGCRCRFLIRYDHDHTESRIGFCPMCSCYMCSLQEIVPLRKVCRRPETDYRLQQLNCLNDHTTEIPISAVSGNSESEPIKVEANILRGVWSVLSITEDMTQNRKLPFFTSVGLSYFLIGLQLHICGIKEPAQTEPHIVVWFLYILYINTKLTE